MRVAHAPEMPGTFSPPPSVSDPDVHDLRFWESHKLSGRFPVLSLGTDYSLYIRVHV